MNFKIELPRNTDHPDLNEEYVEVTFEDGKKENIFLHDYKRIFQTKGLYEEIFLKTLQCDSNNFVCKKLLDVIHLTNLKPSDCKVLEIGAGNGVTSQTFQENGFNHIVGIDILKESREAAMRDRKEIFEHYFIEDFSNVLPPNARVLLAQKFDILLIVGAIGMGHLNSHSIKTAFNLIHDGGIIVFNIYSNLLKQIPPTEFDDMLVKFISHSDLLLTQEYIHRKSVDGSDVKYTLFILRKKEPLLFELPTKL